MNHALGCLGLVCLGLVACTTSSDVPSFADADIRSAPVDLTVPSVTNQPPAPGRRVRMVSAEYAGTDVHHLLYLPTDWQPGKQFPVLVEYAGNGPYKSRYGDVSTGYVEGSNLGYGISAGRGYLWLCLPYVGADGKHNARRWWGDLDRTVAYAKAVVPRICAKYGGNPKAVVLAGFSRGAIACNFIGLHDDEIAKLWCGFVCHSHYDGVYKWEYAGSDRESAAGRLARLGSRPQWITHEKTVTDVRAFLAATAPKGQFTIRILPYRNHSDAWVLRQIPLRDELRRFVAATVAR